MSSWYVHRVDASDVTRDFARFLRRRLTLPEGLLWRAIKGGKADGLKFRKQHPIGPYVLDFYCAAPVMRRSRWRFAQLGQPARQGCRAGRLACGEGNPDAASLVLDEVDDPVRTILTEARGEGGSV